MASTPSDPFYKCFMFKEQSPDMIVDTSGDTFSHFAGDALRSMFDNMEQSMLMLIPNRLMMIGDDPVDYDPDTCNENMGRIVMLQLKAHDVNEFNAAKSDEGENDFRLELRKMPSGYVVALQEYTIKSIVMDAKGPNAPFRVVRCEVKVDDVDTMSPMFAESMILF